MEQLIKKGPTFDKMYIYMADAFLPKQKCIECGRASFHRSYPICAVPSRALSVNSEEEIID